MKRKIPGIMIAAVKSGSGKTTVTCALLEALKRRGLSPCGFKCGPDYIDPMFHQQILKVPSCNIDSFFSGEELLREIYHSHVRQNGIAVVEGVMGLYDGLGGTKEEGSAYHIASILRLPILLVVDAHGMGRSLLPLLSGFLQYDKEKRIRGVILNRTSKPFYQSMAPLIEQELSLSVFGFLPKKEELILESRHLGLKLPGETADLQSRMEIAAAVLEENVSVERILETAGETEEWEISQKPEEENGALPAAAPVRLGIARDEAFCFYYEENLRLLREAGAELIPFSPLYDKELPEGIAGILLGGGYPELYAEKLEKNTAMREAVRQAVCQGIPSVAECGGFLYLHETLVDGKGTAYKMCGALPGKCFDTGKPVRFGYIEVTEKNPLFFKKGTCIKGHEFHYYDSENNGTDCIAEKPVSRKAWDCVHEKSSHFWGFPHLYYPSNPEFAMRFVSMARDYQSRKRQEEAENEKFTLFF